MFSFIWPIALVVISNVFYQICAKSAPEGMHPLATLTVTYAVGAVISGVLYAILSRGGNLLKEYAHLNWAPFVLGLVIVGLEVGFIYAYQAGWQVSTASIVQSAFLAVILLAVGVLIYGEAFTARKAIGMVICLVGMYLLGKS